MGLQTTASLIYGIRETSEMRKKRASERVVVRMTCPSSCQKKTSSRFCPECGEPIENRKIREVCNISPAVAYAALGLDPQNIVAHYDLMMNSWIHEADDIYLGITLVILEPSESMSLEVSAPSEQQKDAFQKYYDHLVKTLDLKDLPAPGVHLLVNVS